MRSNINFILEMINDNNIADKILLEFFNTKVNSNRISLKKIRLKTLISSDDKKSITKKYKTKGSTPLDIVLIECAIEELKGKSKKELLSYFSSKEGMNIPDFYKVCTMISVCPDFIKENSEMILKNSRENRLLFSGIYSEDMEIFKDDSSISHIEQLNEIISDLQVSLESLSSLNDTLTSENNVLEREVKKLRKESEKDENRLKDFEKNNKNLNKELSIVKIENKGLLIDIRTKDTQLKELDNINKKLSKELEENKIDIKLDEFEDGYKLSFIHTMELSICKKLFPDVMFIKYEDIINKYNSVLQRLKKNNISSIILQTNNISTFDIANLKNKLKNDNIHVDIDVLRNERSAIRFISQNIIR